MTDQDESASVERDDEEFNRNVLKSMEDIFWVPEIERRGGIDVTGPITKALAILRPGHPVEVRLNDEADIVARARPDAAVAPGDPITVENVDALERIEPENVHPDAGWVAFIQLPDGRAFLQFDFRRNRGRGAQLLALARQYLDGAKSSLDLGLLGPGLDACHTAAELAVTAMMHLSHEGSGRRRNLHGYRLHWLNQFTRLGNAPRDHHKALVRLWELRPSARYGDPPLEVASHEARDLLEAVEDLLLACPPAMWSSRR